MIFPNPNRILFWQSRRVKIIWESPRRPPILCLSWKSPTRLGLTTAKTKPLPIPAAASGNISRSNLQNETLEDYREPGADGDGFGFEVLRNCFCQITTNWRQKQRFQ